MPVRARRACISSWYSYVDAFDGVFDIASYLEYISLGTIPYSSESFSRTSVESFMADNGVLLCRHSRKEKSNETIIIPPI